MMPSPRARRLMLRWSAVAIVVLVCGALLTAYVKYRAVYDSIHRVPVTDLGKRPPVYSTSALNLLVFGSDSRAGLDHHQQVLLHTGSDAGNNTDTIMVVHISPGRHLVTVMSIPRDTMVPYYECASGPGYPGQQADPTSYERINALLAAGGPSCLWKTIEQPTGIHIDHFVEIGMAGFVTVVNDVGGVSVCAPFKVDDPVSGLVLPAGEHHINGVTALAFWRTREDIGYGSDLQRIQRDQFMSAQVVKGVMASGLLGDPVKLLSVLSAIAPSLTTDSGMSMTDLLHIGESMHGLSSKDVQFVTTPNQPFPDDPAATVEFAQPQADAMFAAIAHDVTIPKAAKVPVRDASPAKVTATARPSAASSDAASPSASPSPTSPNPASPNPGATSVRSLVATSGGINAAASCGSDAGAFAGPLSP
ncbi:MAG TPA: LCP family protein [Trebonia sp.]|nr:LCP family protein [Trebonia sp.]